MTTDTLRTKLGINDGEPFPAYAWPGGYLMGYYTRDGLFICADCANREVDDGQAVIDTAIAEIELDDDPEMALCDDCGLPLDPADRIGQ